MVQRIISEWMQYHSLASISTKPHLGTFRSFLRFPEISRIAEVTLTHLINFLPLEKYGSSWLGSSFQYIGFLTGIEKLNQTPDDVHHGYHAPGWHERRGYDLWTFSQIRCAKASRIVWWFTCRRLRWPWLPSPIRNFTGITRIVELGNSVESQHRRTFGRFPERFLHYEFSLENSNRNQDSAPKVAANKLTRII